MTTIVWLRRDLRLDDQPALTAACQLSAPVIPVFIDSSEEEAEAAPGAASRWWLAASLEALDASLQLRGSRLILRRGPAASVLTALLAETGATAVYWNRRYEESIIARDTALKLALKERGCQVESFKSALLYEPWEIQNKQKSPYRVFTPFWRAALASGSPAAPLPTPKLIAAPASWPGSLKVEDLKLRPSIPWDGGLRESWTPGEAGAQALLAGFQKNRVAAYTEARDFPAVAGTSSLSPHLAFGEISPRRIWASFAKIKPSIKPGEGTAGAFLRQLAWREFAYHLLFHFPATVNVPLRPEFVNFPWEDDPQLLKAWQRGRTGFPLVDAGMRELWHTGWMHNRVRMIVGSFLVKDLLLPWQQGAAWFWDTLVDADLANNTLGWQWIAGCGADAAPYFRVFNPTAQAERFDASGVYVRRWIPELAALPDAWIHQPAAAPADVLRRAGVRLGETYPRPVVDHGEARLRALIAYEAIRKGS